MNKKRPRSIRRQQAADEGRERNTSSTPVTGKLVQWFESSDKSGFPKFSKVEVLN